MDRSLGSSESFSRSYPAVSTKGSFGQNTEGLPPSHKVVAATPHSGGSRKTYNHTHTKISVHAGTENRQGK
ncbi:hypothetical protein U9M48_012565 [Paspalum notatum var. saurae]|uniref:Uncharacterized protein n=1 Tax=Paspalum notatum var. saurae TaxID=547442 RepID=A0AAQ3SXT3_PASNO